MIEKNVDVQAFGLVSDCLVSTRLSASDIDMGGKAVGATHFGVMAQPRVVTRPRVVTQAGSRVRREISHRIVGNEKAIRRLTPEITQLLRETGQTEDITLLPEYFLRNNASGSRPLLVLIRQDERLIAALYGRERRVLGIRSGMIQFGDYFGEGGVIAKGHFRASAIASGALKVLKRPWFHSVRASFKLNDQNEIAAIENALQQGQLHSCMMTENVHHILPLKSTFDEFLSTLGSHTRRNMRVYRRRIEQKGWIFIPKLTPDEASAAFKTLERQQGKHKSSVRQLNCYQAALKSVPGAIHSGIRSETGEWVSLAAGWLRDAQYYMLVQLNDNSHSRDSISTVMRSYLIEDLIHSNVRTLNFVGGCSELLRNFCTPQPCTHYLFEKKGALSAVRNFVAPRLFGTSMVNRIVRGSADTQSVDLDLA